MAPTDEGELPGESVATAERKSDSPPPNQWQFSLRSLLIVVTGWALLLSVAMTVPGLNELPFVIGFLALISTVFFGAGCLLGWIVNRDPRNRDGVR
jgi:hypothetical protein